MQIYCILIGFGKIMYQRYFTDFKEHIFERQKMLKLHPLLQHCTAWVMNLPLTVCI